MFLRKFFTYSLIFSYSLNSFAKGWNEGNDPEKIAKETNYNFEYNFNSLPPEGQLSKKPWTDDYWPTHKRGLAHRWQGELKPVQHEKESDNEFRVRKKKKKFFSEQEILYMSEDERNKLSPAEKYDIINGDYKYTLTKREFKRTKPNAPHWVGICHGWAAAALLFDEPESCKMDLGPSGGASDGRPKLPFASSDVKALLSLMQGDYNPSGEEFFAGTRCNKKRTEIDWKNSQHDNDINAGAFHVIMANRIGALNKGFIFDRTKDSEVWNQPVEGFKSRVIKEKAPDKDKAAPETVKEIVIESVVSYTTEVKPHTDALNNGERIEFVVDRPYEYILELDDQDNIIGGRWISKEYPDFVWSQSKAPFAGLFKNLQNVYSKSTKERELNK